MIFVKNTTLGMVSPEDRVISLVVLLVHFFNLSLFGSLFLFIELSVSLERVECEILEFSVETETRKSQINTKDDLCVSSRPRSVSSHTLGTR